MNLRSVEKEGGSDMQWPKSKNEVNWGTVIGVGITLIIPCVGFVVWMVTNANKAEENHRIFLTYQSQHADLHKDRNVAIETALTDLRARVSTAEGNIVNDKRALDNHEYRITVLSAGAENITSNVSELKTEMSEMRSDIRLTNQRLEQVINLLGAQPNPRNTQ